MNEPKLSSQNQIGVAVIGAGYWGKNLIRNFREHHAFALRWVVDSSPSQSFLANSTEEFSTSIDDALADPLVAAVAIATPPDCHEDNAMGAILSGKHVLVEKPLSTSVEAGNRVVESARMANVILMCDHTYCYSPAVLYIREALEQGLLGDILFIDSTRINLGLVQQTADVIWDLAPHDLSILDFVLPPGMRPSAVSAIASDPLNIGMYCISHLTLELSPSVIAHVHVNWLSPTKVRQFVIGGSKKMLVWDDLNPTQRITIYDKGVTIDSVIEDRSERAQALVAYRTGGLVSPALPDTEALKGVLDEFARSIRTGAPSRTDGNTGVRILQLLELASHSARNGGLMMRTPILFN
jgi:predicted dehydrogenase